MRLSMLALGLVIVGSLPTNAAACILLRSREERMRAPYDAVAVAVITRVDVEQAGDVRSPWQATAQLRRSVRGGALPGALRIDNPNGLAAYGSCRDALPPPHVGEEWVLYLHATPGTDDGFEVGESYPLAMARPIDPRLQGDVGR